MPHVLLVDTDQRHAERIRECLESHALEVEVCSDSEEASTWLRRESSNYEVVVLNISDVKLPWFSILARLHEACFQSQRYPTPLFLCTSSTKRSPEFQLRMERLGARYVYEG